MSYLNRFLATDNLIIHLRTVFPTISPLNQSDYAGFLSVSAVTVYELAIKDIFIEFATKKNKVFGNFIGKYFERVNGRIKLDDIRNDYIKRFGDNYFKRFDNKLTKEEKEILKLYRRSIKNDYSNLIICRHKYVHEGSPTLTINEAMECYDNGKKVIHCLHNTMKY